MLFPVIFVLFGIVCAASGAFEGAAVLFIFALLSVASIVYTDRRKRQPKGPTG